MESDRGGSSSRLQGESRLHEKGFIRGWIWRQAAPDVIKSLLEDDLERTDAELIEAARKGSEEALDELLARHQKRVYRFSLRMCGAEEDAMEVLQQTLMAAFQGIHQFRGEGKLSTWLYQLAHNACIRSRRKRVGEPAHHESLDGEAMALAADGMGPDRRAEARQMGELIQAALLALTPTLREVVILRDIEGLSGEEAAEVLGIELSTLKTRLHRGRMQLREHLSTLLADLGESSDAGFCADLQQALSSEGMDIDQATCERIEEHLLDCETCGPLCDDLKKRVALCKRIPGDEVPPPIRAAVKQALSRFLGGRAG